MPGVVRQIAIPAVAVLFLLVVSSSIGATAPAPVTNSSAVSSASVQWEPEPTVARLGPGLQLTLTTATRLRDGSGAPIVGAKVAFTLFSKTPTLYDVSRFHLPICTAVTDAHGLATCKGQGLVGSLVSVVAGGAHATLFNGWFPSDEHVKLPVILGG